MTLEEALVEVWRQALVEGAREAELEGQKFPVRETPRKHLREVEFVFEGQVKECRALPAKYAVRPPNRGKARRYVRRHR